MKEEPLLPNFADDFLRVLSPVETLVVFSLFALWMRITFYGPSICGGPVDSLMPHG